MFSTSKALFFPLRATLSATKCADDSLLSSVDWKGNLDIKRRRCLEHVDGQTRTRRTSFNGFETLRVAEIIFCPVSAVRAKSWSLDDISWLSCLTCRESMFMSEFQEDPVEFKMPKHRLTIATDKVYEVSNFRITFNIFKDILRLYSKRITK